MRRLGGQLTLPQTTLPSLSQHPLHTAFYSSSLATLAPAGSGGLRLVAKHIVGSLEGALGRPLSTAAAGGVEAGGTAAAGAAAGLLRPAVGVPAAAARVSTLLPQAAKLHSGAAAQAAGRSFQVRQQGVRSSRSLPMQATPLVLATIPSAVCQTCLWSPTSCRALPPPTPAQPRRPRRSSCPLLAHPSSAAPPWHPLRQQACTRCRPRPSSCAGRSPTAQAAAGTLPLTLSGTHKRRGGGMWARAATTTQAGPGGTDSPSRGSRLRGSPSWAGTSQTSMAGWTPRHRSFAAWLAALEGEGYVVRRRAGGGVSVYARRGEPLHLVRRPPGAAAAASGGDSQEQGDIDAFQAIAWSTAWAASTYFVWQLYGWDAVIAAHGAGALLWALVHLRRRR